MTQSRYIDIHPHVVSPDFDRYPLAPLFGKQSGWSKDRPVTIEGLVAAMDEAGVDKAAIVQASTSYGYDMSYVCDAAAAYPGRFTVVGSVDFLSPDAPEKIRFWMRRGLSGLRLFTGGSTAAFDPSWIDDKRSFPAWELAAELGVSICLQTDASGLAQVAGLAKRFPEVKILIDHFGRPDLSDGAPYKKASAHFGLAPFENIYFKLTPRTFVDDLKGEATAETFFPRLVAEFGARRLAWGSNFPASTGGLGENLAIAKQRLASVSEEDRAWIFAKTAQSLYPPRSRTDPLLTLPTNLADYPSTLALKDGRVSSPIVTLDFQGPKSASSGFKDMIRHDKYLAGELAIVTFLQAKCYDKPYVMLPFAVSGRTQHQCIAYNAEHGTLSPKDIEGRRVGVRTYAQTTGLWVRGILQHDYGVDLDKVEWMTITDAHPAEYRDPDTCTRLPAGSDLAAMMIDGEVAAAIMGNEMPKDPRLATLIPDAVAEGARWVERHGFVPINHMFVVHRDVAQRHPDAVREMYRMLVESREAAPEAARAKLPPVGLEANRAGIQMAIDLALEQRIIPRRLSVDELFDGVPADLLA